MCNQILIKCGALPVRFTFKGDNRGGAVAAAAAALLGPFLERMVGVSYIKERERESHYVQCSLPRQFDAWVHIDATQAVVFLTSTYWF